MDQKSLNFIGSFFRNSVLSLLIVVLFGCDSTDEKPPTPYEVLEEDFGRIIKQTEAIFKVEKDSNEIFVRWETPIRYYIAGLENHPELKKLIQKNLAEIADMTGLDIAEHDKMYLPSANPELAEVDIDGLITNMIWFFAEDMQQAFENPDVIKIIKGLGDDPNETYALWKKRKAELEAAGKHDEVDLFVYENFRFHVDGIKFSLNVSTPDLMTTRRNENNISYDEIILQELLFRSFFLLSYNDKDEPFASFFNVKNDSSSERKITEFDKNLFRIYYGDKLESGITKFEALLILQKALFKHYHPEQTIFLD